MTSEGTDIAETEQDSTPRPTPAAPTPAPRPTPAARTWWPRARLPMPTAGAFLTLAVILWLNAIINRYLFNVVLALLATVPVLYLLARGALQARRQDHHA